MSSSRLSQLLAFLEEDPNDPFTIYAVATEYRKVDLPKALTYYEQLLAQHPHYIATYYHVAQLYIELDQPERAESAFKQGITEATAQNDALALRELKNAYNEFLFE